MEDKHIKALEKIFYVMNDDISDAKMIFHYAKECKEAGNVDMASFFLNRAKSRIDMVEQSKNKIDTMMMSMQIEENPYKIFYEKTIDWAMELKKQIMEYRI